MENISCRTSTTEVVCKKWMEISILLLANAANPKSNSHFVDHNTPQYPTDGFTPHLLTVLQYASFAGVQQSQSRNAINNYIIGIIGIDKQ